MIRKILDAMAANERILWIVCILLMLPAFFINLGRFPISMDEPTRALVALEMMFSGNYVTPTIFGEYYYNKPPLYNWILIGLFSLSGSTDELWVRMPTALSLLGFGLSIFLITRRYLSERVAFFSAIMFMTCGRMLVLGSFIGHIDMFYSWLTYLSFIAIYHYAEKEEWLNLFLLSYLITAITFLSKGLPSIVFQGISLLTFFVYKKRFLMLFSWKHFAGLFLFLGIVGAYFAVYNQYNSLIEYFPTLWNESSKRTVIAEEVGVSLGYLFTFPFEMIGHLAPWSLFIVYAFHRKIWQDFMTHPFLKFCLMMLGFNIIIYWLSPGTHPRYIFMLIPLFFTLIAYAYEQRKEEMKIFTKVFETVLLVAMILICVGWLIIPFLGQIKHWELFKGADDVDLILAFPFIYAKVAFLVVGMAITIFLYLRLPKQRFTLLAIFLLLFRMGYNWVSLEHLSVKSDKQEYRESGYDVAEITQGEPLYVKPGYTFNHDLGYYISKERGEILGINDENLPGVFYICTDQQLEGQSYKRYLRFITRHQRTPVNLVKFNPKEEQ